MRNPICLIKTIWRSLRSRAWIMGHKYIEDDEPVPANIQVLRCVRCGYKSTAWTWKSCRPADAEED